MQVFNKITEPLKVMDKNIAASRSQTLRILLTYTLSVVQLYAVVITSPSVGLLTVIQCTVISIPELPALHLYRCNRGPVLLLL